MTKISVVTAVYNSRETVSYALDSVLAQNHSLVESIVIDGASTDGTLEVLDRYRDRVAVLVSEPDGGIYDALNKGVCKATGDVIGFLHADDVFANENVLSHIAAAFADPKVQVVYGDLVYVRRGDINEVVRYWRAGHFDATALRRGWMPPHPTFYVRKEIYERLGLFDTRYRIAADYDCILRFLSRGILSPTYLPEVLVRMRTGGVSNRSFKTMLRKSREDYQIVRHHAVGGVGTVLRKNVGKLSQFWRR